MQPAFETRTSAGIPLGGDKSLTLNFQEQDFLFFVSKFHYVLSYEGLLIKKMYSTYLFSMWIASQISHIADSKI